MDESNFTGLNKAQKKLLIFVNSIDGRDIADSLRSVLKMVDIENRDSLTEEQKDDLFILEKIIEYSEAIAKT